MDNRENKAEEEYSKTRTGETFWFTIAGYLAVVFLTLVYIILSNIFFPLEGSETEYGLLILALVAFSIIPYPAFFLDSVYVRRRYVETYPDWRRYFMAGILTPICTFIILVLLMTNIILSVGISLVSFLIITILSSVYYLYNRMGALQ